MKITQLELRQYTPGYALRQCFKIEHKGKSIEYMPSNFEGKIWKSSLRNCLIRTLKSKYNEVWPGIEYGQIELY